MTIINNFTPIEIESPVDKIIRQIRELITSGELNPNDRLPPERKLCEAMGVGRSHLRDAIKKLEFYGIVKTLPQSGTVVSGMGITALEGLISNVLKLEAVDFRSMAEARVILESNIAAMAAEKRTDKDLIEIEKALKTHKTRIESGEDGVEEDLLFHLKIAEASKNPVLRSLLLTITPDVVGYFRKHNVCSDVRAAELIAEHELILNKITDRDVEGVKTEIKSHLNYLLEFSQVVG